MDIKEWHIYVDESAKAFINGLRAERVLHPHWSVVVISLCRDSDGQEHYQHHGFRYGSVCYDRSSAEWLGAIDQGPAYDSLYAEIHAAI